MFLLQICTKEQVRISLPSQVRPVNIVQFQSQSVSLEISWFDHFTPHIGDLIRLTITSPMPQIIKALKRPNGGIQLRDHKWLKMTINNSFLGEDLY